MNPMNPFIVLPENHEEPGFPIDRWITEVYNRKTLLGYREWVDEQQENDPYILTCG